MLRRQSPWVSTRSSRRRKGGRRRARPHTRCSGQRPPPRRAARPAAAGKSMCTRPSVPRSMPPRQRRTRAGSASVRQGGGPSRTFLSARPDGRYSPGLTASRLDASARARLIFDALELRGRAWWETWREGRVAGEVAVPGTSRAPLRSGAAHAVARGRPRTYPLPILEVWRDARPVSRVAKRARTYLCTRLAATRENGPAPRQGSITDLSPQIPTPPRAANRVAAVSAVPFPPAAVERAARRLPGSHAVRTTRPDTRKLTPRVLRYANHADHHDAG